MKPAYAINLIRGKAPPKPGRRRAYRLFMAYLVASGVLLVLECHLLAKRFVHRTADAEELARLQTSFHRDYPAHASAEEYARELGRRLEDELGFLEAAQKFLREKNEVAPVLVELQSALPRGMQLGDLAIEPDSRRVQFDVIAAVGDATPRLQPSELTECWNASPELARHARNLETVLTERRRLKGSDVQLYRFTGQLVRGKEP